jgi:hypothetical protein
MLSSPTDIAIEMPHEAVRLHRADVFCTAWHVVHIEARAEAIDVKKY